MNQTPKTGQTGRKIVSGGTTVRIPKSKNKGAVNNPSKGGNGSIGAGDPRLT